MRRGATRPFVVARAMTMALGAVWTLQSCRFPAETIDCDGDDDCTAGEAPAECLLPERRCTYFDEACTSQRRYGAYSTGRGECVPAGIDGGSGGAGGGKGGSANQSGAGGAGDLDGGGGSAAGGTGSLPDGGEAPPATLLEIAGRIGGRGTADGRAFLARFDYPEGLAYDGERYLYVPDYSGQTIRRIDTRDGDVTTFAGEPDTYGAEDGTLSAARFSGPESITYDGSAPDAPVLFVAEYGGHRVRRIDLNTGMVTTIVGDPEGSAGLIDGKGTAARLHSPEDTVRGAGSLLYVADAGNNVIRSVDLLTLDVKTVAGDAAAGAAGAEDGAAAQARFDRPYGLAFDAAKNRLFISEFKSEGRVRVLDLAAGTVSTLVAEGLSYPASITYHPPDDRLYVVGNATGKLLSIHVAQKTLTPLVMEAGPGFEVDPSIGGLNLSDPLGVAMLPDGTFFVTEGSSHTIRKLSPTEAGIYETTYFAGMPDRAGHEDGAGPVARFDDPGDVLLSPDGKTLYVVDRENHAIRSVDVSAGEAGTFAGDVLSSGSALAVFASTPEAIVLGVAAEGAAPPLYLAQHEGPVSKFDLASGAETVLFDGVKTDGSEPDHFIGVAVTDTTIYLSNEGLRIFQMPIAGGVPSPLIASAAGGGCVDGPFATATLLWPVGLLWDGGTRVFVADAGCHTIRALDLASGKLETVAGDGTDGVKNGTAGAARFSLPTRMRWDRARQGFHVTDGNVVRYVDASTFHVTTVAGDPAAHDGVWLSPAAPRLNTVGGVAEGDHGELYLTSENAVLRFDAPD